MATLRRLVRWGLLILVVLAVTYAGLDRLPGDAVTSRGTSMTPAEIAQRRRELGLDQPLLARFLDWAGAATHGDLGVSLHSGVPVAGLLPVPLANSATLCVLALLIGTVLGTALGGVAGLQPGSRTDGALATAGVAVLACPEFVLAAGLALLFGTVLGIFPTVSLAPVGETVLADPIILGLPTMTLALICAASLSRAVRGVVAREVALPHVEAARLAGLAPAHILLRHVLPGCRVPVAQAVAVLVPATLGGAVVVEKVFGYPGIGSLLVDAVIARDAPVAMAVAVLLIALSAVGYATADLLGDRDRARS